MIGRYLLGDWSTIIIGTLIVLGTTGLISPGTASTITVFAVLTFVVTSLITRRGRFLPWRSFLLPLTELERLKGKQYAARSKILFRRGSEEATWLTVACLAMEFVVSLGLLFLVISFIPQGQGGDMERIISGISTFEAKDVPTFVLWMLVSLYLVAVTAVGIFYTGGGFGLYLNSHTLLEGWDVELSFRKLAARITAATRHSAAALVLTITGFFALPLPAPAQDAPPPEETIESVLAHEDFIIHKATRKELVDASGPDFDMPSFGIFSAIGQFLFWGLVVFAVIGLAVLIYKNRHVFTARGRSAHRDKDQRPKARTLMGMNVAPETLPDDISNAAWDAWRAGDFQKAISYLYRGSLCWLIERESLPIHESDTEGDCVRHAVNMRNAAHTRYFSELTNHWIRLVYAKHPLTDEDVRRLCEEWPFDLRRPSP
jgi:hypothetical protein